MSHTLVSKSLTWTRSAASRRSAQEGAVKSAIELLFNAEFYSAKNSDVSAKLTPFTHFLKIGLLEGRDPSALFSSHWYLETYPEVGASDLSPLLHFLKEGWRKGYDPNPLFDIEWYIARNSDVAEAGVNPLLHFIEFGSREGRSPNPLFDTRWYMDRYPDVAEAGMDALSHFISHGAEEERLPSPLFETSRYLDLNPSVRSTGYNPLAHFLSAGVRGLGSSEHFDGAWYLLTYTDVAEAGQNPLVHYLRHGAAEGRDPGEHFSTKWYAERNQDVVRAGINPLVHYITCGLQEGRQPHPRALAIVLNGLDQERLLREVAPLPGLDSFEQLTTPADREPPRRHSVLENVPSKPALMSFDIWSTVLHRECHPDEIKLQSARFMLLKNLAHLKPAYQNLANLLDARIRCENASAPYGDHEYRFNDAMIAWVDQVSDKGFLPEARALLCNKLLEHELNAEACSTWVDPRTTDLARKANAPSIYLSDFYMDGQFMDDLLRRHNVRHLFAKGYVSSDTYETKRSGLLFKRILKDFDLEPYEILHVGDNLIADQQVPDALGIGTLAYNVPDEEQRLTWYGEAFWRMREGRLDVHEKRIFALLEDAASGLPDVGDEGLKATGLRMAPLVFSYCLSILEAATSFGDDVVYFFTREGYFSKDVFDAICAENPFNTNTPKSEILEVSRKATFAASLKGAEPSELLRMWSLYSKQSAKAMCRSLNLDEAIGAAAAEKVGLKFDELVHSPASNPTFLAFLAQPTLAAHAKSRIEEQRASLLSYLADKGIEPDSGKGLCVADIGWRGTIQDNLSHVLQRPIRGHYLALFGYLNPQPPMSSKVGWLSDGNVHGGYHLRDQVAPLEMIFNGPGGSVTGYEPDADGHMVPRKVVIAGEEAIVDLLAPFREGMIAGARLLARYVRLHGLMAGHLLPLTRRIADAFVDRPPSVLADAFGKLEHNEGFGVGDTDHVNSGGGNPFESGATGSELHTAFEDFLHAARWQEAAARESRVREWWKDATDHQKSAVPLAISSVNSPALIRSRGSRLAVYAPPPIRASGGHRTIFNMVRRLAQTGFEPHIYLEGPGDGLAVVEEYLAGTSATVTMSWRSDRPSDFALATIAHSAEYVAKDITASLKGYLVQDFEALFNPVSDRYVVCENSFAQGLHHFTVGNWLTHVIQNQYGGSAAGSGLGVDTSIYKRLPEGRRQQAVCMLVQPDKPRRGNDLGLAALSILKSRRPDVEIYIFGSDERLHLNFETSQLGLINNLNELNTLYNSCTAGICISLSNPSRIPFEMIASGCVPVDIYRYNNLMDYDPSAATLAYQSPMSIAKALEDALDADDRETRAETLAAYGARRTLNWETDGLVNNVGLLLEGLKTLNNPVQATYTADATIDPADMSAGAAAFCAWQRQLANTATFTEGHTQDTTRSPAVQPALAPATPVAPAATKTSSLPGGPRGNKN